MSNRDNRKPKRDPGTITVLIAILGALGTVIVSLWGTFFVSSNLPIPTTTSTVVIALSPFETFVPLTDTAIPIPTPAETLPPIPLCGEDAFNNNLKTPNPIFKNSAGYTFGWIIGESAFIELENGNIKYLNSKFVLIVEDTSTVKIHNVKMSGNIANISGCWYPDKKYEDVAQEQICKLLSPAQKTRYYIINISGLGSYNPINSGSCP